MTVPFRGDELMSRHLKLMGDLGQVVPVAFDLRDESSLRDAMRGSSVVINLLGKHFETPYYSFADVHVDGTRRVADIAREEGVSHFVHVSTAVPVGECSSAWLASKIEGEQTLREVFPDATVIRPTDIFGTEDRLLTRMATNVMKMPVIPVADDGESRTQPVWVNDVAKVVTNAARDPEAYGGATIELGGPEVMTVADLYNFICKSIKREARFFPVPAGIMAFGTRISNARIPILNPYPVYTGEQVKMEAAETILNSGKEGVLRFEDLDIQPLSVESDIAEEVLRRFRRGGDRSSLFYVD